MVVHSDLAASRLEVTAATAESTLSNLSAAALIASLTLIELAATAGGSGEGALASVTGSG